ncbi:MAG: Smr/MutS family protein [Hyphomicrobium sp.]|nr:Smr/MutS family protein [Hyphomicrobium sp.]
MTRKRDSEGAKRDRHKGSDLSDDDASLWAHATKTMKPLQRAKGRIHSGKRDDADPAKSIPMDVAPRATAATSERPVKRLIVKPSPDAAPPRKPVTPRAQPILEIDPKAARKLRRGHLDIEARIDLHGMRQAEAHAALVRFIRQAHAKGKRWVLVITGKGKTLPQDGDEDGWGHRRETGVLKRNVPIWLAEPDMQALIVGVREAAIDHGGSGALYIHIRRNRAIA